MIVGSDFLHIQGSPVGDVGCKYGVSILVNADGFHQPVCRDGGTIGGGQLFRSEQSESNVFPFLIHAEGEGFVLFQQLLEGNLHFLAFIDEANAGGGNLYFLTGIGQNDFLGFRIDYHAIRRSDFLHLIAAEIQRFRGGGPVTSGGQSSRQFACFQVDGSVRGNNIFQCCDLINSARLALHLILRLVHPAGFCNMAEYFALFGDCNRSLLRNIVFLHCNHVL